MVVNKLQAKYHVLYNQAVGSIINVGNVLFGREQFAAWKEYEENGISDSNTYQTRVAFNKQATILRQWRYIALLRKL